MRRLMIPESNILLRGMPWFTHNGRRMWRLPYELEGQVTKDLWSNSLGPTGARFCFRSDTTTLKLWLSYAEILSYRNLTRVAAMGFDVYADGIYWNSTIPDEKGEKEYLLFDNAEKKMREITIYCPLFYPDIDCRALLVDNSAVVEQPSPYAVPKPVVFYGTSITHGGCASRPGLAYEAILARELNIDFINLGFSGCGKGERSVAAQIAGIDAACFVLDFGQNNTNEELAQVYLPFIEEIRIARPDTPILLSTPIFSSKEHWSEAQRVLSARKREIVRAAYTQRKNMGDRNIHLVEGYDLLSPLKTEGFVDGGHPNDLGFQSMAHGFKAELLKILNC